MRILVGSNYFPEHTGGVEVVAANLTAGYRAQGHQVRWAAAEPRGFPHEYAKDDRPLRCWNWIESRFGVPLPVPHPRDVLRLREDVAWADVLHLHDSLYLNNAAVALFARRLGRPILLTQHIGVVPYRSRALRQFNAWGYAVVGEPVMRRAAQVVFLTPRVRDGFVGRVSFSRPPAIIANGVDGVVFHRGGEQGRSVARRTLGVRDDLPLMLFVGRFVEKKGLHHIEAVARRRPDWQWVLVGRPGEVDPPAWGLNNVRVNPPLPQHELAVWYRAADVLVLPSRGEGFPLSVQEAAACGTASIVSEETMQGVPEAPGVVRGVRLSQAAIDAAILEMLADRGEQRRREIAGYAAQNWDSRGAVDSYLRLLVEISAGRQPA